jgi:hypothetical protein
LLQTRLRRPAWTTAVLFLLAFFVRGFLWFRTGLHTQIEVVEIVQTALSFARQGVLGNPFILPTGSTAHITPAFPFFLGLIYRFSPNSLIAETLKNIFSIALSSLQYALLPTLAHAAGIGSQKGVVAGVVGAALPMLYLECSGNFEAPIVALTIVLMCIGALASAHWRLGEIRVSFALGLLWGLTSLISAQLMVAGALYGTVERLRQRRFVVAGVFWLGMILAITPWTVRNYVELGSPIFSRDNAGIELWVSNNDRAEALMQDNFDNGTMRIHPHNDPDEARLVQRLGEVRYNAVKQQIAMGWIDSHRARFAELTWQRFLAFWFPEDADVFVRLYYAIVTVLGITGLILIAVKHIGTVALLVGTVLVVYPLPHYFVQVAVRYRYPLNSTMLLLSCFTLGWLWGHVRPQIPKQGHRLAR